MTSLESKPSFRQPDMPAQSYRLLQGIRAQIDNDSTPRVRELVEYVLAERPAVRGLQRTLHALRGTPVPTWFALLNASRCYARMRTVGSAGGIFACARRDNEVRGVEWLRHQLGADVPWTEIRFDLSAIGSTMAELPRQAPSFVRRASRFAKHLAEREEMFQVLRVLELMFYKERLGQLLDASDYRVAVMSSYSNPWGVALNLAATERDIPVLHVMHGTALDPVPRLHYAAAILNDQASRAVFERAGCRIGTTVVRSAAGDARGLRSAIPERGIIVGVLLSKEPAQREVIDLIRALLRRGDVAEVRVRPHPANLWTGVTAAVSAISARASVSTAPAAEDYARCHVVIAGRSSVHLDALIAGVPSVCWDDIDQGRGAGALAFLDDGTVYRAPGRPGGFDFVREHYDATDWESRFRAHVNTGASEGEVRSEIRVLVHRLIQGRAS